MKIEILKTALILFLISVRLGTDIQEKEILNIILETVCLTIWFVVLIKEIKEKF